MVKLTLGCLSNSPIKELSSLKDEQINEAKKILPNNEKMTTDNIKNKWVKIWRKLQTNIF